MSQNNFMYCITYKDQFAERLTKGFIEGNYSTDGNWVIGDKGDQDMQTWCNPRTTERPQWLKDILVLHNINIDSCCFGHEVALAIVGTKASAKYASDGFTYQQTIEERNA